MANQEKPKADQAAKRPPPGAPGVLPQSQVFVLKLLKGKAGSGRDLFRLQKERIVLGAVVSADVRLEGEGISPIHAVIERSEAGAVAYDLASETGLFVNGKKVISQELKKGDVLTLGRCEIEFGSEDIETFREKAGVKIWESEGRRLFIDAKEDMASLLLQDESVVEEIFDYRPTQKKALEVVMSWRGTILDVEHFVDRKTVTVGHARGNDFGIPPLLSAKNHALVSRASSGEGYLINLDSQMSGVISRRGQINSIDASDLAGQGGRSAQVALDLEDFAKIQIGEVDFYLSYTAAPPRLKASRIFDRDPFFLKILVSSMLLTAFLLVTLWSAKVPPALDAEEIPERMATILYQPQMIAPPPPPPVVKKEPPVETKVEPPKREAKPPAIAKLDIKPKNHVPKVIPKEIVVQPKTPKQNPKITKAQTPKSRGSQHAQAEAKEGEGTKAAGKEGSRGSKTAAPGKVHQETANRPSPEGGQGKGSGNSQVVDEGDLDLLKGASGKIQDLLGNSAANLGKGGEKLKGFGGFTTQGNGGMGLSGSANGGGGDAASLGGQGEKGRGGGRVGTGMGAAGSGSGIAGGSARVAIRTGGPEEAVVMGSIDADAVEAALLAQRDRFRLCYEKEVNGTNSKLAGRIGTNFVIGSSGRVTHAGVQSTTMHNQNVESCVIGVIKSITFPIPRGAGVVQVTYPFKFSAVGG
jgi:hypothetical protein